MEEDEPKQTKEIVPHGKIEILNYRPKKTETERKKNVSEVKERSIDGER